MREKVRGVENENILERKIMHWPSKTTETCDPAEDSIRVRHYGLELTYTLRWHGFSTKPCTCLPSDLNALTSSLGVLRCVDSGSDLRHSVQRGYYRRAQNLFCLLWTQGLEHHSVHTGNLTLVLAGGALSWFPSSLGQLPADRWDFSKGQIQAGQCL